MMIPYCQGCSNPVQSHTMRQSLGPERIVEGTLRDPVAWSDNDIRKLVCLYKRNPCLWKRNDPFYLVSEQKRRAYEEICRHMTMCLNPKANRAVTSIEIIMKLREVRKSYVTELKKIFEARSSGCRYQPTTEWFHDLHDFLYPYLDYDETVDLHQLVDRCFIKDDGDYRPNETTNQWARKNMERQTTSTSSDGRFNRHAVEDELARSSGWKVASRTKKSRDRSQTPYTMRLTYRPSGKPVSCSSRDSSTEFGTSWSDIDVESGSPAVIRENRLAHDGERKTEFSIDTESGSTLKPPNRKSRGTKRSLINQTGGRILRHNVNEIFTRCVTCQPRNTEPCTSGLRDRNDVRKIFDDRVLDSNVNMNISSQRNAVIQASTVSRSNVPCRISIPVRPDSMRRMGAFRGRKINVNNGRSIKNQPGLLFQDGSFLGSRELSLGHQKGPIFMPFSRYCTCGRFRNRGRGSCSLYTCPFY